jgi:microcystin degradation protein MlrC
VQPLKSLYEQIPEISKQEGLLDASIFAGMPWTDVHRAGMSVQVVAQNSSYADKAQLAVEQLARDVWAKHTELDFDVPVDDIDGAIKQAKEIKDTVFITDSGDNTTGGAAGDGTLVLERLLAHQVEDAVLAGIVDPEAVAACEKAGVGGSVDLAVGGKIDNVFSKPFRIRGKVTFLSPEADRDTRKRAAVVQVQGVQLVLLAVRQSFTSPQNFENVNIDPLAHKIVVVKLGYLFQGLRDIAPHTIMALTPGFCYQLVEDLEYKNVRRPIYPVDTGFDWAPPQGEEK